MKTYTSRDHFINMVATPMDINDVHIGDHIWIEFPEGKVGAYPGVALDPPMGPLAVLPVRAATFAEHNESMSAALKFENGATSMSILIIYTAVKPGKVVLSTNYTDAAGHEHPASRIITVVPV